MMEEPMSTNAIQDAIHLLFAGKDLSTEQADAAMTQIMQGEATQGYERADQASAPIPKDDRPAQKEQRVILRSRLQEASRWDSPQCSLVNRHDDAERCGDDE